MYATWRVLKKLAMASFRVVCIADFHGYFKV
jgi:hypothetical protein